MSAAEVNTETKLINFIEQNLFKIANISAFSSSRNFYKTSFHILLPSFYSFYQISVRSYPAPYILLLETKVLFII
jgi:hypothetical protein